MDRIANVKVYDVAAPRSVIYLLPGLLCDGIVWKHQAEALTADGHEVRIPDFRFFDSLNAMAQAVLAEAPARFALAGHSMGGRVALEIIRQRPDRVDRLGLLDTGTHGPQPGEPEKRQVLIDLAKAEGMTALAARWLPPMVHPDRLQDPDFMGVLTDMVERMSPEIYEGQVRALLNRPDAGPGLSRIGCPVMLGVGRQDGWSPPAQHQAMADAIPQAKLEIFEQSGHMAPMEAPVAVTQALRRWLAVD
ncbi:alpha/beta fold hydrolase [Niveispirillum sp. SYP-B3756]|uniref:alpha/beta fold hydrolase n=1 Tax=Niveispirillum sp. SYP-B3756 TaxID=2662178 RepID=UPI001291E1AE|nr:alpha/beta hydrolase [Niveispirillum sp. SYP-B3756]MQP64675.1 alpha/beta fold hydrolase [Niveispirillum sp. SYP-B3756]